MLLLSVFTNVVTTSHRSFECSSSVVMEKLSVATFLCAEVKFSIISIK